jgi:tRNA pseudouridine38-40 synthase
MPVRLIVSYQGAAFAGWQRQANAIAVQEVLEDALARLLATPVRVIGASRTDAGVHARGQAAHVDPPAAAGAFPLHGLVHGTNRLLPAAVRVLAAHAMPPGFHARRLASAKEYSYRMSRAGVLSPLDAPYALRVPARLDVAAMRRAAAALAGRHDFSAFAITGGSHTHPFRTLTSAVLEEAGEELCFRVVGDGFLRGMVRRLVGTLLDVGDGRRAPEDLAALLAGAGARGSAGAAAASAAEAGPKAPSHGLVLERVFYPPQWQPLPGGLCQPPPGAAE